MRNNEKRSSYLMALQWDIKPVYPVWEKNYHESNYSKENLTTFRFHANVDFIVYIKERVTLKVWKFEVSCNQYGNTEKFKTFDEAFIYANQLKDTIIKSNKPIIDEWFNLKVQAYEVLKSLEKFTLWNKECFARRI